MINFLANLFGYLLNYIYWIFNNFGISIIVFTILVKILLLPITIKNQKTMEKTSKIQSEMKALQFKYKNDQAKLSQEMTELYKRENMSPFSGCINSIVQILLLLSVFYMVKSPLTYMKKVDADVISNYTNQLEQKTNYPEVDIIKEFGKDDSTVYLNMNFLGLDLSNIPSRNYSDFKVLIIPILYVISSIVSTKLTLSTQKVNNKTNDEETNLMPDTAKTMSYMTPILAFSVSLVAPLGLALYWLLNNVLMIAERLFFNYKSKKTEGDI